MKAQLSLVKDPEPISEAAIFTPLKAQLVFANGSVVEELIEEEFAPVFFQWLNDRRQRPHNFELRRDSHGLVYDERLV